MSSKNNDPKWNMREYKVPRRVSDDELQRAKKIFFDLDRDGSGSIDADELAFMLRSLGQNPTDEEVHAMILEYDDGEKDGKIQLREFLQMYVTGLDSKNTSRKEDAHDAFRAFGGNPQDPKAAVEKPDFVQFMLEKYELDVDVDVVFDSGASSLTVADFEKLLLGA